MSTPRARILVFESDEQKRVLAEEALADQGHEVVSIGTLDKLATITAKTVFTLAVIDHDGPHGKEATRLLRKSFPELALVIATVAPEQIGDGTVLKKPYSYKELHKCLSVALRAAPTRVGSRVTSTIARVLLLEADQQLRVLAVEGLSGKGMNAIGVANLAELQQELEAGRFDLVLVDLEAPCASEALLFLDAHFSDTPVGAMSRSPTSRQVDFVIPKPYSVGSLRETVEKARAWTFRLGRRFRQRRRLAARAAEIELAREAAFDDFLFAVRAGQLDLSRAACFWDRLCRLERRGAATAEPYREVSSEIKKCRGLPHDQEGPESFNAIFQSIRVGTLDTAHARQLARTGKLKLLKASAPSTRIKGKISEMALSHVLDQLGIMLASGLSLVESLICLQRSQVDANLARLLAVIECRVSTEGQAMSATMAQYPHLVPRPVRILVQTGEQSGTLPQALSRAAEFLRQRCEMKRVIRQKSSGPLLTLLFAALVFSVMAWFVMPKFTIIYADMQMQLPPLTRFVVAGATFASQPQVVLAIMLIIGAASVEWRFLEEHIYTLALRLPVIRDLVGIVLVKDVAAVLATLYAVGVPFQQGFVILSEATDLDCFREPLEKARRRLAGEGSLLAAFAELPQIPAVALAMVGVGEETGTLDRCFAHLDSLLSAQLTSALDAVVALVEPTLLLTLGVSIGIAFVGMFLPVYNLVAAL
jgi:type II secretory pathway component PulF/DNA-binding response OmpR family regulator